MFSKPGFIDDLHHRFWTVRTPGVIRDIYDGEQYRKLFPDGPLGDWKNISFLWNTDGAPVFKSSSFSIWPFCLTINEMPYQKRIERDNQILAGLWFGNCKPQMLSFLKPIHDELKMLESKGVAIETHQKESFNSKCFLIAGTCDLPAKCLVCNSVQFNGYYGCSKCKIKGKSVGTGKGHVTTFPFEDSLNATSRTKENFMDEKAVDEECVSNGIKGPSWLARLESYDIIKGTGVDYMHCVLLGDVKTLMKLWFSSNHSKESFSIRSHIDDIDAEIKKVHLPDRVA